MFSAVIEFTNLLLASLLVGVMFGVWLTFNPAGLDSAFYVAQQQQGVRTLNVFLPALGLATTLVTVAAAVQARGDRPRLMLLVGVIACCVAAGLITRFVNQRINAVVMTWSPTSVPATWTGLRDAWWRWHQLRLAAGLGGLTLLIIATMVRARG